MGLYEQVKDRDFYKLIGSICRQLTDRMNQPNHPKGICYVREPFCQLIALQKIRGEIPHRTFEQYYQNHKDEAGFILNNLERAVKDYGVSIDRPSMRLVPAGH